MDSHTHTTILRLSGAAFSKVSGKILGKLLILGATDTQVATSSRGYSATVEHCTNRPISSVQRSNRKLCSSSSSSSSTSSSSNSSSKITSFPKILLRTFKNAAPEQRDSMQASNTGAFIFCSCKDKRTLTLNITHR